jgi:redox-sensitive bicupin YhaK (pirin superfamily)
MSNPLATGRTIARVVTKVHHGPDAQVDDGALLFTPTDPSLTDPFLIMGETWFSSPGFEWHPHRGLETVTTVLDGVLEHGDNHGNTGTLEAGDIQWMTAGRGIIHRELAYRDRHAHILQLWINLPANRKLTEARYQDLTASSRPRVNRPGTIIDVISGSVEGATGPALNHVPVQAAALTLDPLTSFAYMLPAGHRALAYVMSGQVTIAGRAVEAGQTAWSDPIGDAVGDSALALQTPDGDAATRLLIYSGTPLGESVALGGPFVMNDDAEIKQAYRDFHAGKFGAIPKQARLRYDR